MILADKKLIPKEILKGSVLVHLAAAYFHITRRMEQKTKCSQTRGFVLATLRGGALLNQKQIATLLGLDRTVVHRAVKSLIREGLLSQKESAVG
jgi:DNA-binding MarR family transcriptional regulator